MSAFEAVQRVELKGGQACGFRGMIEILGGECAVAMMARDSSQLIRLYNQTNNIDTAALEGLNLIADLVTAHDDTVCELDGNAAAWLIKHLVEQVQTTHNVRYAARRELIRRGLDELGVALREYVGAPTVLGVQS